MTVPVTIGRIITLLQKMKKSKYFFACLLCVSLIGCGIIEQPEPDNEKDNSQDPPALSIGADSGDGDGDW